MLVIYTHVDERLQRVSSNGERQIFEVKKLIIYTGRQFCLKFLLVAVKALGCLVVCCPSNISVKLR